MTTAASILAAFERLNGSAASLGCLENVVRHAGWSGTRADLRAALAELLEAGKVRRTARGEFELPWTETLTVWAENATDLSAKMTFTGAFARRNAGQHARELLAGKYTRAFVYDAAKAGNAARIGQINKCERGIYRVIGNWSGVPTFDELLAAV